MTLQDAQKIKQATQELCKKHGPWSTLIEKGKPVDSKSISRPFLF